MRIKHLLFFIFALSGFSGLIYESIWSHYLKLFLGHAAYAQTLVLAIFMGGMSLGSWLSSKYSSRWKNLLLAYAIVELIIGLLGVSFHKLFVLQTDFAYLTVLPSLGSAGLSVGFKWLLAVLFILPQSILLGMTFPLMSAGVIRRYPDNPGSSISMLYFSNSIGGVAGVLCSGFVLIYLVGLPGTIMTAGLINIFLALLVWLLVRSIPDSTEAPAVLKEEPSATAERRKFYWVMLLIAFVTGLASFIYEVGWIRMLSLVLGSSTHAFELMLSAFILGLALGSLWIKRRIDSIKNPIRFLIVVQIVMGGLALSTLFLYGSSFKLMQYMLGVLTRTDNGYVLFNVASHGIALFIMLPATFFAGMTLPLITHILLKEKHGEKSIGAVYAANTIGAISGVVIAVHVAMPLVGLKGLIVIGASVDIVAGIFLIWFFIKSASLRFRWGFSSAGIFLIAVTVFFAQLDTLSMASGVYRRSKVLGKNEAKVVYHRDGKTATVNLIQFRGGTLTITTNGKPDASINMSGTTRRSSDETTMILAGVLPNLYHPKAKKVANIGFGSGQTTHTLLQAPWLERVDTIEIEPAMVEASREFGYRVVSAYTDRRSHIYFDDAKTFFSVRRSKYDIIVSEPSNPWVSGVSSLFTDEFYTLLKRHINKNGIFVQWLQLYENEAYLVASVIKAIDKNFEDYVIYSSDNGNLIIIAKPAGKLGLPSTRILDIPVIKQELSYIDIKGMQDIYLRRIGSKQVLSPYFQSFSVAPNSDYYPVVDLYATKARYMKRTAYSIYKPVLSPVPVIAMLDKDMVRYKRLDINSSNFLARAKNAYTAMLLRDYFLQGSFGSRKKKVNSTMRRHAELVRYYNKTCQFGRDSKVYMESVFVLARATIPYLGAKEFSVFWNKVTPGNCQGLSKLNKSWFDLFSAVGRKNAREMSERAIAMLGNKEVKVSNHRYLLDIAMLGLIAQEKQEQASRLWLKYSKQLYKNGKLSAVTRLLVAHSQRNKTLH